MRIHLIGIGGIGVSALARYYLAKGFEVFGSDLANSPIIEDLKKRGIKIFIGPHQAENVVNSVEKVIYSAAAEFDNTEILEARKRKIQIQTYPEALGELTKKYFTIAVCGAHGKGTTTAFVSLILIKAGFDPTVIVGTNLKEFGNANFRLGKSRYLVIEADEYGKAFLNYWPRIIVVTNIDKEHLDCLADVEDIQKTFLEFFGHLPDDGILILNNDNVYISNLKFQNSKPRLKTKNYYFIRQPEAEKFRKILKIPGEPNISNALAALAVARSLGISDETSFAAMAEYEGAWRRFEISQRIFNGKTIAVISDYAHHPSEIKATLAGAKLKFPGQKILAVFQPHQYQRTYYLFDEFAGAFADADEVVLTEIYGVAGREKEDIVKRVSGEKLAAKIQSTGKKTFFVKNFEAIPEFLKTRAGDNGVVAVMGAGDIYKIVDKLGELK